MPLTPARTPAHDPSAPALLEQPQDQRRRAPLGRHFPFLLASAPDMWEVSSGRIVPKLCKYSVRDGLNGCAIQYGRNGRPAGMSHSLMRSNIEAQGKRIIPHEVDGPGTSYMRQPYPGHFVDRWTTLYEGTRRVSYDQEGYDEWRASLVERGIVESCRRPALEGLERRLTAQYQAAAQRAASIPRDIRGETDAELRRLERDLRVVREALAADRAPDTPLESEGTEATL